MLQHHYCVVRYHICNNAILILLLFICWTEFNKNSSKDNTCTCSLHNSHNTDSYSAISSFCKFQQSSHLYTVYNYIKCITCSSPSEGARGLPDNALVSVDGWLVGWWLVRTWGLSRVYDPQANCCWRRPTLSRIKERTGEEGLHNKRWTCMQSFVPVQ